MKSLIRRFSLRHKPREILGFGFLSGILGVLLLLVPGLVLGQSEGRSDNNASWPLIPLGSLAMIVFGSGFVLRQRWAYVGSAVTFITAYASAINQAFMRVFVWGIFFEPAVLAFLVIPRVRRYFFHPEHNGVVQPKFSLPSTILTLGSMLGLLLITTTVALTVHTILVTEVDLKFSYPTSTPQADPPWPGYSNQTISGLTMTWGGGRIGLSYSLEGYAFASHTAKSLRLITPGFIIVSDGLDQASVMLQLAGGSNSLYMLLQAPDYDYSGPIILEMQMT